MKSLSVAASNVLGRIIALVLATAVGIACVAAPTSEDRHRADVLRADPVFAPDTPGFVDQAVRVYVGHGGGPSDADTEVQKDSSLAGPANDAIRAAVGDATAAGWIVQTIDCHEGSTEADRSYLVRGVKQFDGFVGFLLIENYYSDGPRILVRAFTPSSARSSGPTAISPSQTATTLGSATGTCLDKDHP